MMTVAIRRASALNGRVPVSFTERAARIFFSRFNNDLSKMKLHVFDNSRQIKDLLRHAKNLEYANSEVIYNLGGNIRIVDSKFRQGRLATWCMKKPNHNLSAGYGRNEALSDENILPRRERKKLLRWAIENKETKFGFSLLSSFGFNPADDIETLEKQFLSTFPEVKYETNRRKEERERRHQSVLSL